jgi:hypothetical protein
VFLRKETTLIHTILIAPHQPIYHFITYKTHETCLHSRLLSSGVWPSVGMYSLLGPVPPSLGQMNKLQKTRTLTDSTIKTSTSQAFALILYNVYTIYNLLFNTCGSLYVQVTVHRDKLHTKQPTAASKQSQVGTSSNLTLLGSSHITCMKHTNCPVYSR